MLISTRALMVSKIPNTPLMQVLREIDINPTIIKNVPSALKESYGSIRLIRPPTLFFPQTVFCNAFR